MYSAKIVPPNAQKAVSAQVCLSSGTSGETTPQRAGASRTRAVGLASTRPPTHETMGAGVSRALMGPPGKRYEMVIDAAIDKARTAAESKRKEEEKLGMHPWMKPAHLRPDACVSPGRLTRRLSAAKNLPGALPLPAREKALAMALKAQQAVVAKANRVALTKRAKSKKGFSYTAYGLSQLEALLTYITLVDVQYLVALAEAGGVVPRWQDVPQEARIDTADAWRLRSCKIVPILVLSCPWLDAHHPDSRGATLRRLLPVLRACRDEARRAGPHATFGVFWDYMSLPQKRTISCPEGTDDRSAVEYARFKEGMVMAARRAPRCALPRAFPASPCLLAHQYGVLAAASTCTRTPSCWR